MSKEEDLISRKALQKAIKVCCDGCNVKPHFCMDCPNTRFLNMVKLSNPVEAVTVEHHKKMMDILQNEIESLVSLLDRGDRPEGKWEITGDVTCECPFCHYPQTYVLSPKECGVNFCTHCGADLRSEKE